MGPSYDAAMMKRLMLVAALTAAALGPAAAAGLPLYPGAHAVHVPGSNTTTMTVCGSKMTTVLYGVGGASVQTVAQWYQAHIPGAIRTAPRTQGAFMIFQPDGRAAAAIAPGTGGSESVILSTNAFDPPLPSERLKLIAAATHGDASAKARLKAQCGDAFS